MNGIDSRFISEGLQSLAPGDNFPHENGKTGNVALRIFESIVEFFHACISFLGSLTGDSKSSTDHDIAQVAKQIISESTEEENLTMDDVFQKAIKPEGISKELKAKIFPKHQVDLERKATYFVSDLFDYKEHKIRFLYVKTNNKQIHLRMAYYSRSQGIWRVAPFQNENGEFSKGKCGTDVALPIDISLKLSKLPKEKEKQLFENEYNLLLTKLSKYLKVVYKEQLFLEPVKDEPSFISLSSESFWNPENMKIADSKQMPDFEKAQTFVFNDSDLYPGAIARKIPSIDEKLQYLFIEYDKKVFLAAVEIKNNEISKYGTRYAYLDLGNMTMPLCEHSDQIPVGFYGLKENKDHIAWEYIQQIPLIKKYLDSFHSKKKVFSRN